MGTHPDLLSSPCWMSQNETQAVLPWSSIILFHKCSLSLFCPNPPPHMPVPALELDPHTQSLWKNARAAWVFILVSFPWGLVLPPPIYSPPARETYFLHMLGPLPHELLLEFPVPGHLTAYPSTESFQITDWDNCVSWTLWPKPFGGSPLRQPLWPGQI